MKKTLVTFDSNHNPTSKAYKKLKPTERKIIDKFEKYCLISASSARAKKSSSNAVRFLVMANKPLGNINLEDLQDFLRVLKLSDFSDYYKNDVKGFVQRFLKWYFKDWSERFRDFEDIKYNSDAQRTKKILPEDVLKKEDIEKLIKAETNIFWKTFIIIQYEGALRTLEARSLTWDMIDREDPDAYWLNISSKKNRNGTAKERTCPPLDKAIFYLDELKKESNSPYVFPSGRIDGDIISSGAVSKWFSRLTKKVLGKSVKSYLLRHSKGEELHKLVRDGQLSKENAVNMMGHSEKMFDKTYSHANKQEMKKVLKKQVLDVDYIAPEKKHKLERQIEKMNELMDIQTEITTLSLKKMTAGKLSETDIEKMVDLLNKIQKLKGKPGDFKLIQPNKTLSPAG